MHQSGTLPLFWHPFLVIFGRRRHRTNIWPCQNLTPKWHLDVPVTSILGHSRSRRYQRIHDGVRISLLVRIIVVTNNTSIWRLCCPLYNLGGILPLFWRQFLIGDVNLRIYPTSLFVRIIFVTINVTTLEN